ncbi:hypothetical protein HHL19_19070 [Streptomyces sp. R302]|uniref:hypothetical protein n=1 Tax=unclassified Streptomyces TaxID=2593676 RepID=UPI00145D945D|nr:MULTISPECIES: hypothetical protein [unclassified Streptomyces]NML54718.1 hypothetical protein [Streptomyces sp. R301]NML80713.1 hypothetical protein [Streptomyces sp. R302]
MGTQEAGPFGDGTAMSIGGAALKAWTSASRTPPAPDRFFEGPPLSVDWVDHVDTDPIRALEMLVLGWYPAEETPLDPEAPTDDVLALLPPSLAAFHRLARVRPALYRFNHPMLLLPRHVARPDGGRLVFAVENQGCRDWCIPWPPEGGPGDADPPVWLTEDPYGDDDPETILEAEPLSRFLLQFTLDQASGIAPYNAWTYVMPTERLEPLWSSLRPVPLSPYMPTYEGHLFYTGPGLLASISADETEAVAAFGARHREALASLKAYDFPWIRFDA